MNIETRVLYYDKAGQQIDRLRWAELFENHGYKQVAFDELKKCIVSTVWLGLDHRFFGDGAPIIFETMVFGADGGDVLDTERYSTVEQALAGHSDLVEKWRTQ